MSFITMFPFSSVPFNSVSNASLTFASGYRVVTSFSTFGRRPAPKRARASGYVLLR